MYLERPVLCSFMHQQVMPVDDPCFLRLKWTNTNAKKKEEDTCVADHVWSTYNEDLVVSIQSYNVTILNEIIV